MLGETIGNFKIVRRLGRGGMGEVWLAEQQQLGTKVAIKVLLEAVPAGSEDVQRFFNEARAASVIQHAGITKIFDSGLLADGRAYLVMEFLDGEALASRIARGGMPFAQLAEIGRQIASVLEATHAADIVHRDLKPENVFLIPDLEMPGGERVKVLDFGVAKLNGLLGAGSPKTFGTLGTPSYMAPEQWGDASQVDGRVDLYALGCLTFEMACGRPPFICRTVAEACAKHINDVPPRASSIVANVPPDLDRLIAQLLEKDPHARPRSMREVVRAFTRIGSQLEYPTSAGTLETLPAGSRSPRRPTRRTLLILAGAVAITGMAIAMIGLHGAPAKAIVTARPIVTPILPDAVVTAPRSELATVVARTIAELRPDGGAPKPVMGVTAHRAAPTIDRAAVQAVLDAHHDALVACNKHRAVAAHLTVLFSIGPDGRATQLPANATDSVVSCVLGVIGTLTFPKPLGGSVELAMPLVLEPLALPDHLSKEEVANGLLTAEKELDACMRASQVQTRTVLTASIAPSGQVTSTTVVGALAGSAFEACAAAALRSVEFPPAQKALIITVPISPD